MKKILIVILSSLCFVSCYNNAFNDVLFRTTSDPFYDTPVTDSLRLEHTVFLNWKEDKGCDKFCLMRSFDNDNLDFKCIYEGTEVSYVDNQLEDNARYIYRLDKWRGTERFEGKSYGYGYSSDCRNDSLESNDEDTKASLLNYDQTCNLPCVRYTTNNEEHYDCDWFCVDVPPRHSAYINITQINHLNEGNGVDTNLKYQLLHSVSEAVRQNEEKQIVNTDYEIKRFYFCIYPEITGLIGSSGDTVIEYTVSLSKIININ